MCLCSEISFLSVFLLNLKNPLKVNWNVFSGMKCNFFIRSGTIQTCAIIFQHHQQTKTSLTHLVVIESIVGHPVKTEATHNWLESKQITLN